MELERGQRKEQHSLFEAPRVPKRLEAREQDAFQPLQPATAAGLLPAAAPVTDVAPIMCHAGGKSGQWVR